MLSAAWPAGTNGRYNDGRLLASPRPVRTSGLASRPWCRASLTPNRTPCTDARCGVWNCPIRPPQWAMEGERESQAREYTPRPKGVVRGSRQVLRLKRWGKGALDCRHSPKLTLGLDCPGWHGPGTADQYGSTQSPHGQPSSGAMIQDRPGARGNRRRSKSPPPLAVEVQAWAGRGGSQ